MVSTNGGKTIQCCCLLWDLGVVPNIVLDGPRPPQPFRPHLHRFRRPAPGVPGADLSWVTGLLSPAVRSLLWNEVPRRTSVRLIVPAEPRVVLRARPWLTRTPGPTKPAAGRSRAVRVRGHAYVRAPDVRRTRVSYADPARPQHPRTRPREAVLRCGPGRAPGASSRGRCPACRARPCSGRGRPSRGTGSRGGLRRRSGPPG